MKPVNEDPEQPPAESERSEAETADGPWNQPAVRDARERQRPVSIGGLPATAAVVGEPFLRGSRQLRALLITPLATDPHGASTVPSDPKLPNSQGGISKATISTADLGQPPAEAEQPTLFAELSDDQPPGEKGSPTEQRSSRNLRVPLLVTAAAFALSVGIPIALHASSPTTAKTAPVLPAAAASPSATAGTGLARQRAQLLSWVRSYLPPDSVIVTDQVSRDQLRTAGFSQVLTFGELGDTPLQTVDFVLNVPGATAPLTGQGGRTSLLASSQALAQFGTGTAAATAREFFPQPAAELSQRKLGDAQLRKQGGAELATNPAIVPDAATRSVLLAGQLDLRAQNVLNLLASAGTIYVTAPTRVSAEQQIGQPVRSIVITTDGTNATQNILAAMVAPYKPDSTVQLSQRKLRLTWSPAIAPVSTVGQ